MVPENGGDWKFLMVGWGSSKLRGGGGGGVLENYCSIIVKNLYGNT